MQIVRNIGERQVEKPKVAPGDFMRLLRQDPEIMAAFMIKNNPGSVNATLRLMGYDKLGFAPDVNVLAKQLQTFIDTQNWEDLNQVINKFSLKTDGLDRDFITLFNQNKKA